MRTLGYFALLLLAILLFILANNYILYGEVKEAKKDMVSMNECTNLIHQGFDGKYDFEQSTGCDYDKTVQEIIRVKRG